MLMTIEPKDHPFYKSKIGALLDLFKIYQGIELSFEEEKKATFIIAEDNERGVYGGALLLPEEACPLPKNIRNLISFFLYKKDVIWTLSLCLALERDESYFTINLLDLYKNFYQHLFDVLVAFGRQKEIEFLHLTLAPPEYDNLKKYGVLWLHMREIKPIDSTNDFFYGILPLTRSVPANAKGMWRFLSSSPMRRIAV